MKARLLYLTRTVLVELDDPSLLDGVEPIAWQVAVASRVTLTPCRGGALFCESKFATPRKFATSSEAAMYIDGLISKALRAAHVFDGEATATGRYHLDRARKWDAVREFVADQAPSIWPAEVAS